MKSFQEFTKILNEKIGDFGATAKYVKPKENCYGKTVDYKMAPGKKVCAKKRTRE
jgi:hypothetical protein